MVLALAACLVSGASVAPAQDPEAEAMSAWQLEELHQGFCVQLLVDPAEIARRLPGGVRPLPADQVTDLHASIESVIASQPEFTSWAPSRLCLFYFDGVQAAGRRVSHKDRRKAPMLALWTVAAAESTGERGDVALEIFTNNSRLERSARLANVDLRVARTTVGDVPEDDEGRPSPDDRYEVRIGKTQITWDGRPAADSTPLTTPLASEWRAEGRRGGWVEGSLTINAAMTGGMIGSLKVSGEGDLAEALRQSPIRFVGPGYQGGAGSLAFGR
ncbi:MAG TPA: hypothetical protein VMN37_07605 [Gemmatimonadales bacterium]|nr:hypothetical protein [Gemmatimonadales bacterium]